jgi:Icc-related predicted phosphoesterase
MKKKYVLISDTHGFHRDPHLEIPDCDVLIHAGDLTMAGEIDVLNDVNNWFNELHKKDVNEIIVIAGNHDITLGTGDMLGYKLLTNAIYLQNSSVKIDDKIIWGCPDTPWKHEYVANMFAFGKLTHNMGFKGMPKDVDILVTHCPPYGYGDLLSDYSSDPNTHIGSRKLLELVNKYKPILNVFGHIHEGYGIFEEPYTTFINASVVNEHYNLTNEPIVMYI